jgi:hypothetical protein
MIAPMRMHSGTVIDLAHPDPALISLEDIAYHTAGIFRWTGASRFTVAQHSVHVYELSGKPWGLLHDLTEAFVGDVSHHLKQLLGAAYRRIEQPWKRAVIERFGVPEVYISWWDQLSAQLEANTLWPGQNVWVYDPRLLEISRDYPPIEPWDPEDARIRWLMAARALGLR